MSNWCTGSASRNPPLETSARSFWAWHNYIGGGLGGSYPVEHFLCPIIHMCTESNLSINYYAVLHSLRPTFKVCLWSSPEWSSSSRFQGWPLQGIEGQSNWRCARSGRGSSQNLQRRHSQTKPVMFQLVST